MVIMPGICGTHSQVRLTGAVDARDNNACRAVRIRQIRYTPRWMQEPIHKPGATLSVHCGDVKGKWQPHFSEQSNEVVCLIVNI